jgi:hypothetical protein
LANRILKYFDDELKDKPCSEKHHLNVKGGLNKHLVNVYRIAEKYFPEDEQLHFLALIHDIGKARVYLFDNDKIIYKEPNIDHIINTIQMLSEYYIRLTDEELNALQFHHGGWSGFKGEMTELAIKLHFCDMMATINE